MGLQATIISLSSLALVSLIPPFFWHIKTKNVSALMTIVWLVIYNLKSLIDASIWSDTGIKFFNSWDGKGWCDIMIKLEVGAYVGVPCCIARIAYQLTEIIKAETILPDRTKRTYMLKEFIIITTPPLIAMLLSYFVQIIRYGILTYSGCQNVFSTSWVTIVVYALWPFLFSIVGLVLSLRLLLIFYIKRTDAKDILQCTNSGLTLTKFFRFLFFCFLIILIMFPSSLYTFIKTCQKVSGTYSYPKIHQNNNWWTIFRLANESPILSIWLFHAMAFCAFFIFGTSSDALSMYATTLRYIGLGFVIEYFQKKRLQKKHKAAQAFLLRHSPMTVSINNANRHHHSINHDDTGDLESYKVYTPTTVTTTPGSISTRYDHYLDDEYSYIQDMSDANMDRSVQGTVEKGFDEFEIEYSSYKKRNTTTPLYEQAMRNIIQKNNLDTASDTEGDDRINFHYVIKNKK